MDGGVGRPSWRPKNHGSFVTDIIEPNDVDCVLLSKRGLPKDPVAEAQLRTGLPFLDIALVRKRDFERMVNVVFATDRFESPKGMVEIVNGSEK